MEIEIIIPGSKSIAARSLVCRLLSGHNTVITNLPDCGDTRGMLRLTDTIQMALTGNSGNVVSMIGEGGTTLRFGMAACASLPGLRITLTGSHRLMQRPHATLISALRNLGADIELLPEEDAVRITGKLLTGGTVNLPGDVSSQYLSALMLAAPVWRNNTLFKISSPVVSVSYIYMTAGVMRSFGAKVDCVATPEGMEVKVGNTGYAQCARYDVEGDWSGASYFFETRLVLEAAGMSVPELLMPTLKSPAESLQGDSRVVSVFAEATQKMRTADSSPLSLTLTDAPDLVPAVAVGLCLAGVRFRIDGVGHLRHKECDRMAAITCELRKLGYLLSSSGDVMEWNGERTKPEDNPRILTYQDHRMAMAFAPASLLVKNQTIENPEVTDKSFPGFWNEIKKLGVG